VVDKEYTSDKKLITFRSSRKILTEEQKTQMIARMRGL
jgi:hypothetical protein